MTNVNYTNTGFDELDIDSKMGEIEGLFNEGQIIRKEEIKRGRASKVVRLDFFGGRKAIMKISPFWHPASLAKERWFYSRLDHVLRLAEVYEYLPVGNALFPGHEVLFLEYLEGTVLSDSNMPDEERHRKLGKIYSKINALDGEGYGWLGADFRGVNRTWKDFLVEVDNIGMTLGNGIITDSEHERLVRELRECAPETPRPALLYGDANPDNQIVAGNEIIPIDFQNCFVGHELYDIGIVLSRDLEVLGFIGEYAQRPLSTSEMRLVNLYAMRFCLSAMGHYVSIGFHEYLPSVRERFDALSEACALRN